METSVLNRLDKTAAAFPDKVMFRDETAEITFGEFDRLTKAVGTYLAQRVPAGSPVAVMSGRHILTPSCFLGAVRAG
ncbi:MAG: amino acid adenylation protein, partial [Ruminococcus sp.]|nr:amino acid adenylation protein [Ruminococcus sp.]